MIAPLPIWTARTKEFVWRHPGSTGRLQPDVVHPSFLSYSNKRIGPISTHVWTERSFCRAVARGASHTDRKADVVYSHFLFPAGVAGAELSKQLGCPSILALGESSFDSAEAALGQKRIRETIQLYNGILSVS